MSCAVILFTRDLRVRDQAALAAATREAVREGLDYPDPVADHEECAVQFRRFRESGAG